MADTLQNNPFLKTGRKGRHSKVKGTPPRNRTPAKKKTEDVSRPRSARELLNAIQGSQLKEILRVTEGRLNKAFQTAKEFSRKKELEQISSKPEIVIQYFSEASSNMEKAVESLRELENATLGTTRLNDVGLQKTRRGILDSLIKEIDTLIASVDKINKRSLPSDFMNTLDQLNRQNLVSSAMASDLKKLKMSPFEKARTKFNLMQERANKLRTELESLKILVRGDRTYTDHALHN